MNTKDHEINNNEVDHENERLQRLADSELQTQQLQARISSLELELEYANRQVTESLESEETQQKLGLAHDTISLLEQQMIVAESEKAQRKLDTDQDIASQLERLRLAESSIEEKNDAITSLQAQLDRMEICATQHQTAMNAQITEKCAIYRQLASVRVDYNVLLSVKARINALLEARTSEVNNLQDTNTQFTSENRALTKELQAATDEKKELQAATDELQAATTSITSELEQRDADLAQTDAKLATALSDLERKGEELISTQSTVASITSELEQKDDELAQTNAVLATANDTIEKQRQEIEEQTDEEPLDSEDEESTEEEDAEDEAYVCVNHDDDPDDLLCTGTKVEVRIDSGKDNGNWKATILKRYDRNNEIGFHIHYEGNKSKTRKDWVAYDHIISALLTC